MGSNEANLQLYKNLPNISKVTPPGLRASPPATSERFRRFTSSPMLEVVSLLKLQVSQGHTVQRSGHRPHVAI